MNVAWHTAHPIPKDATPAERLAWHEAHQDNCGCRGIPESLKKPIDPVMKPAPKKPRPRYSALDCD